MDDIFMSEPKIDFIIIGAQKSASSFVHSCLLDHPEVLIPKEEISYFQNPDYKKKDLKKLILGSIKEYNIDNKKIGIKRPNYLGSDEVPERIFKNNPEIKLIAILRNPVERAISAYFHYIKYGFIPLINLEEGLLKILNADKIFLEKYPISKTILEYGLYGKHLKEYLKIFKKNQIKIILHEEIINNPLDKINEIYKFLNIKNHNSKYIDLKPAKVKYNYVYLRILTLRNKFIYSYSKDKKRVFNKSKKSALDYFVYYLISFFLRILSKIIKVYKKPKVSEKLSKLLFSYYKDDINLLSKLTSRDLNKWIINI